MLIKNLLKALTFAMMLNAWPAAAAPTVTELSASEIPAFVAKHANVVLQITSSDPRCGYCVGADTVFDAVSVKQFDQAVVFARVQWSAPWSKFPVFTAPLVVSGVPEQKFFKDGKEVGGSPGIEKDASVLFQKIKSAYGGSMATEQTGRTANIDGVRGSSLDFKSIPTTSKKLGSFPYFSAPDKTEYINRGGERRDFDVTYVPTKAGFAAVAGESFKAHINAVSGQQWQEHFVSKSYEQFIVGLGGVKVFDGSMPRDAVEKVKYYIGGTEGSIDFWNKEPVKVYAIRHTDGTEVVVMFQTNTASGKIQIIRKTELVQSIEWPSKDQGAFPFLTAPTNTEYRNGGGETKEFDETYVPLNGTLVAIEGASFKADISKLSGSVWSKPFVDKSYESYLISIGAKKVYDGIVPRAELNKFISKIKYTQGAMSFQSDDPVQLFFFKPEKTVEIYVMLQTSSAGGKIQIVQKGEFKQTIKSIEADDIQKQIDENGKAVLSINFDTDKATLKEDGQQVVAEIAKLLAENVDLKVSIEGHTDNSGTPARNRSLSAERARTVLNKLVQTGVEASRLKATGFGADKPLVANDSEDNKALNRRVELVKF